MGDSLESLVHDLWAALSFHEDDIEGCVSHCTASCDLRTCNNPCICDLAALRARVEALMPPRAVVSIEAHLTGEGFIRQKG